jgi:MinD-like ATPase involved in chromosome partitioning or flagellar assembly
MRQGVAAVIASAPELFHESVRAGVPVVLIEPSAPPARSLLDLAEWLADKQPDDDDQIAEPVLYVS